MMRIAIANTHLTRLGGTESYLDEIASAPAARGDRIAFLSEHEAPPGQARIGLDEASPTGCSSSIGVQASLERLREWKPDMVYVHRLDDFALGVPAGEEGICRTLSGAVRGADAADQGQRGPTRGFADRGCFTAAANQRDIRRRRPGAPRMAGARKKPRG